MSACEKGSYGKRLWMQFAESWYDHICYLFKKLGWGWKTH